MAQDIRLFSRDELKVRDDGLKKISACLDELGIDFFLIMGILLGAVREQDFIKWDWDIELGLFTESVFNRKKEIETIFDRPDFQIEIVNESFDGFKINLFYFDNKYTLWGLHKKGKWIQRKSYRFPKKYFDPLEEINFRGSLYKTPNNREEFLKYIYGDWETPKKTLIKEEYLKSNITNKGSIIKRLVRRLSKSKA